MRSTDSITTPPRHLAPIRAGHLAVFLAFLLVLPAAAQDTAPVPRNEEAEAFFQQALEAFEYGDYGMAYRRFRLVYGTFPLNRKTTAAMLMAGKALYREGEYEEAASLLTELAEQYPTSGYLDEAERTRSLAHNALAGEEFLSTAIDLGIALPLRSEDAPITQALFNGIRLAVDEHNARPGAPPVRMIFRDSGGDAEGAGDAVRSLIDEEADFIIGPLYSPEATAAAEAAETARVVLVAPLATDEGVAEGRQYVFQANPTISMRGRRMARFAIEELDHSDLGVIAERDVSGLSERMAEGFQDEALRIGADVDFFALLPDEQAWSRLPEEVGAIQLSGVSAVYLPLAGSHAARLARTALAGLDSMGVDAQVFGNSEWAGMSMADPARYNTVYSQDFLVDESRSDVQDFLRRYEDLAGSRPTGGDRRLAFTGYDVARYLIEKSTGSANRSLAQVLQEAPPYQGLGIRIHFDGGNVNEALYILGYRNGRPELLR